MAKPRSFDSFAQFYKRYLNAWSVAAAALPIPVTSMHVIPTYEAQKPFLMLYTSLFCFLLLGFAFYSRHTIARVLAPEKEGRFAHTALMLLPGAFIAATFGFILAYHWTLQLSLTDLRLMGVSATTKVMLEKADYLELPRAIWLALCYLGMFISAEAAFILMALKEYLLDARTLTEAQLDRVG
jgi:hypothetical protein